MAQLAANDCPALLEAGQVYRLDIRMTALSKRFKRGSRIRVTVASGARNLIFPNSNTADGFDSAQVRIAKNRVHHGEKYPFYIQLTIE